MDRIDSYDNWLAVAEKQEPFLLFVKTNNCSVCDGLLPQVAILEKDYAMPFYIVNIIDVPEVSGQLSLFSAPVVLLFDNGKEYARFARFVRIGELEHRLQELIDRGKKID